MRQLHQHLLFTALLLFSCASPIIAAQFLYIQYTVQAGFCRVDTTTGDRTTVDYAAFPFILNGGTSLLDQDGGLLIRTFDNLQRPGIQRIDPLTLARTPISGGVDGFAVGLRGNGPPFPGLAVAILRDGPYVYTLHRSGTLMRVDPVSGDRQYVLDGETTPTLTQGSRITAALDMQPYRAGRVLVLDQFEGFLEVSLETSQIRSVLADQSPASAARDFVLLSTDHVVYTARDFEFDALISVDLVTGASRIYSGTFGGIDVGSGPAFGFLYDIAVLPGGRLYAFDLGLETVLRIESNGDRVVVSGPERGLGDPLPDAFVRPTMGHYFQTPPVVPSGWTLR